MNIFMKYGVMASSGGELIPQWTKQTEMNVLPDSDGWSLTQTGGSSIITNEILNITTSTSARFYEIETSNIIPSNIKRLEVLSKVNSQGGTAVAPSQYIGIGDGVRWSIVHLETDKISYYNGTSSVTIGLVDMTSFKKVRIEVDNVNGLKVYVDDIQLGSTIPYTSLFASTNNSIRFGDSSGTSNYDSNTDYDYIYYQLDLANNPDQ